MQYLPNAVTPCVGIVGCLLRKNLASLMKFAPIFEPRKDTARQRLETFQKITALTAWVLVSKTILESKPKVDMVTSQADSKASAAFWSSTVGGASPISTISMSSIVDDKLPLVAEETDPSSDSLSILAPLQTPSA